MHLRRVKPPPWLDPPVHLRSGLLTTRVYAPGDCWFASPAERVAGKPIWTMYPDGPGFGSDPLCNRQKLSIAPEHAGVIPVIVVLPSTTAEQGIPWCVHGPVVRDGRMLAQGWTVTGGIDRPEIDLTVIPSINYEGHWHGYVRNGSLV